MPRAGLSPDRVAAEAEALADEIGFGRLTLAAVAARLDVRLPSLYKHVQGLDGLRRDVAVRSKVEMADVIGRAVDGLAGEAAVGPLARALLGWAREHPGRYAATVRAPEPGDVQDEAASASLVQVVSRALTGFDLEGDDAVDAVRMFRSLLHGFVSLEAGGGFALPVSTDASFDAMVAAFVRALRTWSAPGPP